MFPFGGGAWNRVLGKGVLQTAEKVLAGTLALLGSEGLGQPVGAKAERMVLGFGAQRNPSLGGSL